MVIQPVSLGELLAKDPTFEEHSSNKIYNYPVPYESIEFRMRP